jgi:hypothetical protein
MQVASGIQTIALIEFRGVVAALVLLAARPLIRMRDQVEMEFLLL